MDDLKGEASVVPAITGKIPKTKGGETKQGSKANITKIPIPFGVAIEHQQNKLFAWEKNSKL